ncbi:hypothetical protein [Streptomyces sp. NRRL S-146]|uniref:hypothetical protein n=1 Tax=Streptomyces sp. NRRL S-146 TaxID=1463884 RepID=UPI0004C51B63|nr:hypothetical protein [Streptomyces sp. NRRL S-146]
MTAGWCCRALRAAVFAAVCVLLAALGHRMMSGSAVPWWSMAAAFAGVGGAAWPLAGRERGRLLVVCVAVATQAALHMSYSLAQAVTRPQPPALPAAHQHTTTDDTSMQHMAHLGHMGHDMAGTSSTGMLAAHVLAALLCSLWLAHGERAVFRILRALAGWLAAPLRLPVLLPASPQRPRTRPQRHRSARTPRQFLLVHSITSRGPPTRTAVA